MLRATRKIQQRFSKSSKSYDHSSSLHREIADKLLSQVIKEPDPASILDVGCGTGYLTGKLKDHFELSKVIGLDFAQGMIDEAKSKYSGIAWVLADGNNLPFSRKSFDLVISNLAYQWAEDLPRAFTEASRVLSTNGVFTGTLFGYSTCPELFQSLNEAGNVPLKFARLPNSSQVYASLGISGFKNVKMDCELIKIEFGDMRGLLAWLKSIGANNLSGENFLGPEIVSRAALIYKNKFAYRKGVGATFEVIWFYAKK